VVKPGFTVVSHDFAVGLLRPRHLWTVSEDEPAEVLVAGRTAAGP
jgi:hypothetical protein